MSKSPKEYLIPRTEEDGVAKLQEPPPVLGEIIKFKFYPDPVILNKALREMYGDKAIQFKEEEI